MVTVTAVAGAPWSLTWIVQVAVLPRATVAWAAWTLTHSCGAVVAGLGEAGGVADGDAVLAGRAPHWEVMAVAVVTAAAGGGM